jgi:hypothetical protein
VNPDPTGAPSFSTSMTLIRVGYRCESGLLAWCRLTVTINGSNRLYEVREAIPGSVHWHVDLERGIDTLAFVLQVAQVSN